MSTKDHIDAERKSGITSEQFGLLVVMIGVVLMGVSIYTTEKVVSFYFNIGLFMLVLGSCLFALFIWARGYSLKHMSIPLPEVVREMLRTGIVRREQSLQEKSGFSPRPSSGVSRTVATQPLMVPPPQSRPETHQPVPVPAPGFASPQPYTRPAEPGTPAPIPVTPQPQATPPPMIESPAVPVSPVRTPEPVKPKPKKEEYMDVLEEADREFESYIDKLIEE